VDGAPRWRPSEGLREAPGSEGRKPAPLAGYDLAYYVRFTVYLGSHGNFDYWGDPTTGGVCYVGDPSQGCHTGGWGGRDYWRSMTHYHAERAAHGACRSPEGVTW
jgi:hypothetical protein